MRRLATVTGLAGVVLATPGVALAHGVGGRQDLPIPLQFFQVGAGAAIVISFVLLGVLWPEPRLQDGPRVRHLDMPWVRPIVRAAPIVGLVGLGIVFASIGVPDGLAGASLSPFVVWIGFWLVVPFVSALVGDVYTPLNPWRALGGMLGWDRPGSPRYGIWPATAAFVAFTWVELVAADSGRPRLLAIAALAYTGWLLLWMQRFGTTAGLQTADAFTSYNRLISAIAPLGRGAEGRLVWRGWLRALPVLPRWPGLTAFVIAMIGTVTYDGLSATPTWRTWWGDLAGNPWFATSALVGIPVLIGAAYYAASWAAVRLGGVDRPTREVAASFAHTLVPIGLAYAFAHYFTLILFEGQRLVINASDPFGFGWNLFGTGGWNVNFTWFPPAAVWWVQLLAIVAGHIAGVVLAHDRALAEFPEETAVRTQWAMLGLMVLLTGLGLYILAEG